MIVGFVLQAACQTVFVACFINFTFLSKLNVFKSRTVKISESLAIVFDSDRNARMVTPAQRGDSSGSVSSPTATARGGCLMRSKSKVRTQRCLLLQPIQEIQELDKVFVYSSFWLISELSWSPHKPV